MDQLVAFLIGGWIALLGISGWLWYKVRSLRKSLDTQSNQIRVLQEVLVQHQTVNEHTVEAISYLMVRDGGQWYAMGERGDA